MAIIGKKEMENQKVSIRTLADSETETMPVNETIKKLKKLVLSRLKTSFFNFLIVSFTGIVSVSLSAKVLIETF